MIPCVGFAVAGGRSRRMGRDKAALPWGAGTLLGHALDRLQAVTPDVRVLCGAVPRYLGEAPRLHVDLQPDAGPLGGLFTALSQLGPEEVALVLGVDLPFAPPELLRWLVEALGDHDAVVPMLALRPQPLCAAYRGRCLTALARRLAGGERRMTSFWPDVRVRLATEEELNRFGRVAELLRNLNTPEDYEAAAGYP